MIHLAHLIRMENSFIVIGCEGEQLFSLNFLNSIFDSVVNFALFFRVGIFVITVIVGLTFLLNSDFCYSLWHL